MIERNTMVTMKLRKLLRRSSEHREKGISTEEALKHLPQRPMGPVIPGTRILRQTGRPDRAF